jgi:hypothetical protein
MPGNGMPVAITDRRDGGAPKRAGGGPASQAPRLFSAQKLSSVIG